MVDAINAIMVDWNDRLSNTDKGQSTEKIP